MSVVICIINIIILFEFLRYTKFIFKAKRKKSHKFSMRSVEIELLGIRLDLLDFIELNIFCRQSCKIGF